jgi:8-oxo-dGTP diphosphatase
MIQKVVDERAVEVAVSDAEQAIAEFDGACRWLVTARQGLMEPLR